MSEQFNNSGLKAETQNDPAFPQSEERGTVGDLGAGLLYVRGEWYVGASAQHLNFPTVEFGKSNGKTAQMDIKPTLYLTGGCNIALRNPLLQIQPAIMAQSDPGRLGGIVDEVVHHAAGRPGTDRGAQAVGC